MTKLDVMNELTHIAPMYDDFIEKMYDTFSEARRPTKEEMTIYKDFECAEIMEKFSPYKNCDLPDEIVSSFFNALVWLKPEAFRYYLPRYIEYDVQHQDYSFFGYLLYEIVPENFDNAFKERFIMFTDAEKEIIVQYLQIRQKTADDVDQKDIQRGLEIWKS